MGIAGICQSMLASDNTDADRQLVVDRERELNGILADVCGQYTNCRFDDLAVYSFAFTRDMVSTLDTSTPASPARRDSPR